MVYLEQMQQQLTQLEQQQLDCLTGSDLDPWKGRKLPGKNSRDMTEKLEIILS